MTWISLIAFAAVVWLWRREERDRPLPGGLWIPAALASALAVAAFAINLFPIWGYEEAFPIDDSYITLTAARNFAERGVFAVNPAAPGAGITSPLHVLAIGLLGRLTGVAAADRLIGLLAYLATVIGTAVWARRLVPSQALALACSAATALCGATLSGAMNGLETGLFTAFVVWSFALYEIAHERPGAVFGLAALLGLAILTRPEGYFLAAALFGALAWRRLKARDFKGTLWLLAAGALTGAIVAPYLAYNYAHVGQLMPSTVDAKRIFFGTACQSIPGRIITVGFAPLFLLGPFAPLAPLALFSIEWRRRGSIWLFVALFYGIYLLQFPGALVHYWGRYQHPLAPLLITGMTLGLAQILRWLRRKQENPRTILRFALGLAFVVMVGLGAELQHALYRANLAAIAPGGQIRRMIVWLQMNTGPGDVIAAHDIGYLSYYADRSIVDLVGLTDPEIARIHRDAGPPCSGTRPRAKPLYELLRRRGATLVLMAPEWQSIYLGLANFDNGQRMRLLQHFGPPKTPFSFRGQVNGYDVYSCDWSK